jgi:hypothetical protein
MEQNVRNTLFFDEVIKSIEKTKSCKLNYIPFSNFKRFKPYWSGVYKSDYAIITAGSGVGKSKLAFNQYIFNPINFYINNLETQDIPNLDIRINLYALEESKTKVFLSCLCNKLAEIDIFVSVKQLKGIPSIDSITNELLEKSKGFRDWFDIFERKINVYNSYRSSYQIHKKSKEFLDANGKFKDIYVYEDEKRIKKEIYVENNPNLYFIAITDTINLLTPTEKEGTLLQAIAKHSGDYNLRLRDTYNAQIVDIQQQDAETGKLSLNMKGQVNEIKNRPTKAGLADNKQTYNNANQVITLYAPNMHNVTNFNSFDITALQDSYRYLEMLKTRDDESGIGVDMLFRGATNTFTELPMTLTMKEYDEIIAYNKKQRGETEVKEQTFLDIY